MLWIFWLYKPSLWPWHWTQWTNFSAWHSGSWWCITIPSLVTKCLLVGQTLTFWPLVWLQFFTEHSGLWCCITAPSLVTKCSVVQKISSRQTFTEFWITAVTLTLDAVIKFFHRTLQLMMQYYQSKFGYKWNSSLEDIVEIVIFCLFKPSLWLWHWR